MIVKPHRERGLGLGLMVRFFLYGKAFVPMLLYEHLLSTGKSAGMSILIQVLLLPSYSFQ